MDDFDVEVFLEDLELGFLCEESAYYVVHCFLELLYENVGVWG